MPDYRDIHLDYGTLVIGWDAVYTRGDMGWHWKCRGTREQPCATRDEERMGFADLDAAKADYASSHGGHRA